MRRLLISAMILIGLHSTLHAAPRLPRKGPVPITKPITEQSAETATPAEKPEPDDASGAEKDADDGPGEAEAENKASNADAASNSDDKTSERKEATEPGESTENKTENTDEKTAEQPPASPPVEKEDPAAYAACIADLKALGATFTEGNGIDDGDGCGIAKPVTLSKVLPGISLAPEATIRCETALELARMTRESLIPAARKGLPEKGGLTSINQASGYVCRLRNSASTGKISEHARGNAIDIASLSFGKETVPMRIVKQDDSTLEDAFQRTINAAACLYFTTVLSPGSDAAHQDHMHLDVIERNGGYRYCR